VQSRVFLRAGSGRGECRSEGSAPIEISRGDRARLAFVSSGILNAQFVDQDVFFSMRSAKYSPSNYWNSPTHLRAANTENEWAKRRGYKLPVRRISLPAC